MMIAGIAITATVAGKMLDPFSPARLVAVAGAVAGGAFLLTLLAVWGVEGRVSPPVPAADGR
jgi:BCD family chlorophyll transporter-like MFS transporter